MPSWAQSAPCDQPEARQFDFWAGKWDVYEKGEQVGFNHISIIQGGCTLLEEYHGVKGPFEGKSFNYYDPSDTSWHQVWVDNSGTRLHLVGGFDGERMVMSGSRLSKGAAVIDRIAWTPHPDGTVRQVWDYSRDEGKTFTIVFDGLYRPHPDGSD